jgi:hypothetical protein
VFSPEQPIDPEENLYRAYSYEDHCDQNQEPQLSCFLRRKNEPGLSVSPSIHDAITPLEFHFGCCRLVAGEVLGVNAAPAGKLSLFVYGATHASIRGMPLRNENSAEAFRIASDLQKIAKKEQCRPKPRGPVRT